MLENFERLNFYFPVDIFDLVTSLARASRSRVSRPLY